MQRNTRTNRTLAPWLIGVFLASLLFALLYAFSPSNTLAATMRPSCAPSWGMREASPPPSA